MKINSGIDLVEVERLRKAYKNFGSRFLTRIYDPLEIEQFNKSHTELNQTFLLRISPQKKQCQRFLELALVKG